ncbi:unnamed protein product [Nyctereutes procyonoides]|uniref:(raccoon dog) hypothetical protein n=1 Tax=Nyctereutes procyonoides TaxID=34880 RepID=A0A811Z3F1_NYCPR|nr:unnamed protein product [Nyctereutes procyonoides]
MLKKSPSIPTLLGVLNQEEISLLLLSQEKVLGQNSTIAAHVYRKKQKLTKERAGLSKLPDLKDAKAVQKFFLEKLLAQGEYEKGVDHLTNAVAVKLPPPMFQMLLTKLPTIREIVSAQSLAEDDVE